MGHWVFAGTTKGIRLTKYQDSDLEIGVNKTMSLGYVCICRSRHCLEEMEYIQSVRNRKLSNIEITFIIIFIF